MIQAKLLGSVTWYSAREAPDVMTFQSLYEPGMIVKHPNQPEWGLGQVQSSVGGVVTVNFQEQGKVVIHEGNVILVVVSFG